MPVVLAVGLALVPPLGTQHAAAEELPPGGTFVDDDDSTHEGYIEALVDEQVTYGCGDEVYCPTDEVTRGQMAAFIDRALGLPASSTDHFADDDGNRFEPAINALADADITTGCAADAFCPDEFVTRGEMAAFLRRAGDLPAATGNRFTDDDDSRFEGDIEALAAAGVTVGCNPPDNTLFCPDATTTRAQMASFIGRFLDLQPTPPPEREDPASLSPRDAIRSWFPEDGDRAIRVADCESSLNPEAVNPRGFHGLFQISEEHHRAAFERVTGQAWEEGIYTSYYNAQYARDLHDRSGGWGPWPHCGSR